MRGSFAGLCLLTLAGRAEAFEARRRFAIDSKPYAEALIDLAVQGNVSLLGASACGAGGSSALAGRYTLSEALARMLAGAPCAWKVVDAHTVRITPVTPTPRDTPSAAPVVSELLVTASKRPERPDDLPAGVSVISGDQLFVTNAYDARATAGQLAGVLTTNLGPGRDKLMIRGLSDGAFTGRARSTVSTYLNDDPINYNAPDPDLRLVDVAQVETLRGPQGALYGSGALSGVYRIVTNKPDPDRYAAGVQASGANTVGGSPSYDADGYINVPLADGRAALRLVAYYDDQGGYLDDLALRLSNVDSTLRTGGRAALGVALGDSWTADLSLVGQRLSSRDTQYTTLTQPGKRANQVREASENDFAQASVTLNGELGWGQLTSSTSYVQHAYGSLYDATSVASQFVDTTNDLGVYDERARIHRLVQDVVLTSTGAGPVSWLVGAYGAMSQERTPSTLDLIPTAAAVAAAVPGPPPPPLTNVYNENRMDRVREGAVYGEGTWRFAPGWSLSAGARAFDTNLKVNSVIVGAPPAQSRTIQASGDYNGVSPKLSLQYQFDDGLLLYGLYSEGFRPGGVNTTNFVGIKPQRTTFDPDRLKNFEFGAKGQFLDHRLSVRTAVFYDLWDNIQSDQYGPQASPTRPTSATPTSRAWRLRPPMTGASA